MHLKKIPVFFLLANFLFTLHYTVGSYIHSKYLGLFIPLPYVGLLFSISSLCALIVLSYLERFLILFGERTVTLFLLGVSIVSLGVLSWHGGTPPLFSFFAITAFIAHFSVSIFILRTVFDIYFEEKSDDKDTGIFRGELLTAANIAWVASPLILSQILFGNDFWKIYSIEFFVAVALFALLYLRMPRRGIVVKPIFFIETLKSAWKRKKILLVTLANFLMHFFFSWMIIYLSPYLIETQGFSWENVGLILSVMLLPYVLIDIPLGVLLDRYGEKIFLAGGFLIMSLFTLPIGFVTAKGFLFWAIILFATRVGAATVELATDTYLFRNVEASDGNMISFYRYAQPMAYIVAPLSASVIMLLGATEQNLFLTLSGIIFLGVFITLLLPGKWLKNYRG